MNKLYKIGPSQIHGNGLIATQDIEPNQMIGLSHRGGQVASELGQYVNHSDNPTAISMPSGNERYIISNQFIKAGGEITQNYRFQPELEQPEDFMTKAQNGGQTEEYRPQTEQITTETIVDPNIPLAPTQDEQLLVDYYQPVVDWFSDYLKSDYYKTLLDKELPGGNVYSKKTKKEATERQLAYTENYPYTDPKFDPYGLGNQYLSIYNYMEPDRDSIYKGAFYRPGKKYINMYGWQYPGSFGGGKNIMAHELGHTDDGIISGPSWDNWIREHNKLVQSGEVEWKEDDKGDHSSRTEETRSDIIRLRYMLDEAGLFDTTGEYKEFTEEDYDKAFEKFGNLENTDSRIFKLYNKEDVIYLMNNMANIDTNPFEIVDDMGGYSNYMSKEGGELPKAQFGKGLLNLIKGAAKTRPLTNETIFRGLHLNNQIRNLPMFKGLNDDQILEIMATTIPGHTGTYRKGQFENTMNFGRDFDMAAEHIHKFTRSPKGIFRIGNAPLAKEGTYPINPNSFFNIPPVVGGDNFVVGTTPFSDIDFMSPERIKAFLSTARTTYDKNSPNGIQDIITKQKAILDGLPSVIRTEGVNVIEGNFPQFVGQQGTPMGVLQDIQLVKKDGGELSKAQGGKTISNIITRLGSPKVAKDYGFPLPSIKGFTPPFTAPLPLVQGRNTFNNETIFTKLHDQRTHPRVQDFTFEDMTGEYDWLVQARQHSNNIVQAKNPVFDSQGKLFSYDMPDLTQQGYIPLHQYLTRIDYDRAPFNKPQFGKDYILKRNEVYNVIRDLNSKGLFHLDLHSRNVMIKPDPTDLKILDWKIIDPVGLPKITQDINIQNFPPLQHALQDGKLYFSPGLTHKGWLSDYYNSLDFFKGIEKNRHRGLFDYMEYSKKQWPWDLKEPFQFGGTIGRSILFPKKVLKKVAIDNRFLPTKKLNNVLSKNFNQGEQLLILSTLKQNPQLIQNNNIDITKLQEAVDFNLRKSQPFLTDVTSITKIPLGNTVGIQDPNLNIIKSNWTNIETGDDLGLYRYSNLLPSQFTKGTNIQKFRNTSGGTSYLHPLVQLENSTVTPLNYSFSMPGLFTDTHLPRHHDGLKLLDENAMGWLRGFVDERFPNTYMLKEAQIDLSKDPLSNVFKTPTNYKTEYPNINDLLVAEHMRFSERMAKSNRYVKRKQEELKISEAKLRELKDIFNNNYGLADDAEVFLQGNRSLTMNDVNSEIAYLEELIKLQKEDLILGAGRFLSVTDPMQASRIFNNPYFTLHNEMLPLLRDKGFTQIGIPGTSTIENIQGWTGTGPMKRKGVFDHYSHLSNNPNLQSASLGQDRKFLNNMYQLDNYVAHIYDILNKPYKPFKQEGGEVYKYERSPFKDGKFVISNPEDLIIEISKTEVFTPEFKMGGTTKMNEYSLEKKFDNDKKLPYIEYTGDPDLEGRVYYDDETNEIVDVTTLELKKKRRHNRIKVIIDKYEEGNELTHTEKDVLNSLGLLD